MAAGEHDITIEQGATFQLSLLWEDSAGDPVNVTGYSARMQVREKYTSTTTLLSLTSVAGDIVLGGAAGTIVVTASATATAAIDEKRGVYDLEMVSPSGTVTRLIRGCVTITPEVTR
jgi:hypothetical protein